MAASIIDVAKKAGVSKSTVSRVLTGGAVKPVTKDKIHQAMEELGYVPNVVAQALRGKRDTKVIGIYFPFMNFGTGSIFGDTSISVFIMGLEKVLISRGYDLLFIYDDICSEDAIPKYVDYFAQNRIDGLVTLGNVNDEKHLRHVAETYKSVVYTGRPIDGLDAFNMYISYYEFNLNVYEYLHSFGHKRIISVTDNPQGVEVYDRKIKSYQRFCQENDLLYDASDFIYTYEESNLKAKITAYIEEGYTAVFCERLNLTIQIMHIFYELGLTVGKDISLIGVEPGQNMQHVYPDITAIEIPYDTVGEICGKQIVHAIEGGSAEDKHVTILPKIVEKKSVARIV